MRSPEQLIGIVLGLPGHKDFRAFSSERSTQQFFRLFEVELPIERFRGFPPLWHFGILDLQQFKRDPSKEAVIAAARSIIEGREDMLPLALISDTESCRLGDDFSLPNRPVICLDANDIPPQLDKDVPPQVAPLTLASRRGVKSTGGSILWASPYQPNVPVSGWRFIGRKQELRKLVQSAENFVLVGARRTGKSSLMQETRRLLKKNGEHVHMFEVGHCRSPAEVVAEIVRKLSPRDLAHASQRADLLHDSVFAQVLKQMTAKHARTTLLLDELGNVIADLPKHDWQFLGVLRKFGQSGRLRFIISCFQEVFLRQTVEFSGPLINFATTMRLGLFAQDEVEQLILGPLEMWQPLEDDSRRQLIGSVLSVVGRHPLMLQVFGQSLMENATRFSGGPDFVNAANTLLRKDLLECFSSAVDEVFFKIPSATIPYLFVRRCFEAEAARGELKRVEWTEEWIDGALTDIGYESTLSGRRSLLEGMQVHGLTAPAEVDPFRQVMASPLIYLYVRKAVGNFDRYLANLVRDMGRETSVWGLNRIK